MYKRQTGKLCSISGRCVSSTTSWLSRPGCYHNQRHFCTKLSADVMHTAKLHENTIAGGGSSILEGRGKLQGCTFLTFPFLSSISCPSLFVFCLPASIYSLFSPPLPLLSLGPIPNPIRMFGAYCDNNLYNFRGGVCRFRPSRPATDCLSETGLSQPSYLRTH